MEIILGPHCTLASPSSLSLLPASLGSDHVCDVVWVREEAPDHAPRIAVEDVHAEVVTRHGEQVRLRVEHNLTRAGAKRKRTKKNVRGEIPKLKT